MITKQDVLNLYKPEIAKTIKVLKAVPADQLEFKPHERSGSVKDLLRTFIVEMVLNKSIIKGIVPENSMQQVPNFSSIDEGIAHYENISSEFIQELEKSAEDDLQQSFSLFGMDAPRAMFLVEMMLDMIHHRGQVSVYIRLAGGKVPSIYGPSADDKGTE